jgi:hypothetical protein
MEKITVAAGPAGSGVDGWSAIAIGGRSRFRSFDGTAPFASLTPSATPPAHRAEPPCRARASRRCRSRRETRYAPPPTRISTRTSAMDRGRSVCSWREDAVAPLAVQGRRRMPPRSSRLRRFSA